MLSDSNVVESVFLKFVTEGDKLLTKSSEEQMHYDFKVRATFPLLR